MTVTLTKRADIDLNAFLRVAWRKEDVRIDPAALALIERCRASFLRLIETDPTVVIYGVTTAMGELASTRLAREERDRHARIKAFAAATSFGEPFPDRVVRGFALARLANFLEGHAATTPRIALAVADMLDGRPMPVCARCTGLYLSAALAGPLALLFATGLSSRRARVVAAIAAVPTLLTWSLEFAGLAHPSNVGRAAAALPLGFVAAWLVVSTLQHGRRPVNARRQDS